MTSIQECQGRADAAREAAADPKTPACLVAMLKGEAQYWQLRADGFKRTVH
jgi:hypothetical protein